MAVPLGTPRPIERRPSRNAIGNGETVQGVASPDRLSLFAVGSQLASAARPPQERPVPCPWVRALLYVGDKPLVLKAWAVQNR